MSRLPRREAIGLLCLLAACGGEPDECNTFAECDRLLAIAEIDGRPLSVTLDASENNGITVLGDSVRTVVMIAFRPMVGGGEGVQFWLDGFHGVGAYPVVDYYGVGTAMSVYWREDHFSTSSFWGQGALGDTVWVAAYDSLSGEIQGSFQFTGVRSAKAATVAGGRFRGVVHPYVAGGSPDAAGRIPAAAPPR
jgi:hypothetical protein